MSALPDAVLFDMDGTLIDSEGLWLEAEVAVMAGVGAGWTEHDQAHCLGGPLERVAAYMVEMSGTSVTAADMGSRLLDEVERLFREAPLAWRPGARALVLSCREDGIPTALVSASWNRLIAAVGHKIDDDLGRAAFDVIVAGDDVEHSKPHPDPYLTAARSLGVAPQRCLAFEDSPTGVRSAVAAGCRVVAIPHISAVDTAGALVVDTLDGWTIARLWHQADGG